MTTKPLITRIEIHEFWHEITELGMDYNGFNSVYEPGTKRNMTRYALKIETDLGIDGIRVGGGPVAVSMCQKGRGWALRTIGR